MISQLTGILDSIEQNNVTIDVQGVGYKVFLPTSAIAKLSKPGEKIKIFTHQVVREDSIDLYGFLRKEERGLFSMLLSVSGIGPKSALALLSGIKMEDLVIAIAKGSVDLITTVPGVGLKTAQRLVIELKEKVGKAYAVAGGSSLVGLPQEEPIIADAIAALMTLGYTVKEAREAIMRSGIDFTKVKGTEDIIKQSLKALS
ncbi:MAG: Holliday junction branch migration protein RuvA [bacterium]